MNTWEHRKLAIVEADDFMDDPTRNGLDYLIYWKAKYPKFKISLFTVPNKTTPEFLKLLEPFKNWIELVVHGWNHDSNFECWHWDEVTTKTLMEKLSDEYKPFFKAPGWSITPNYSGYKAEDPTLPVVRDAQCVYKGLRDGGFIVFDRHYNKPARPENSAIVCVDCQEDLVHMHTWPMETGIPNDRNGFPEVELLHGVPWDQDTEFKFVSEAWEEGLFKPCNP